ncbi:MULTISPECIES: signal peptidase II [Ectothiorhodospira]|uniref:signal peptidase II n=1 Tax=Ectothiorhodospira TaxID=1051 RepID=UPI001EE8B745|nr:MULTISPECIES: signal peptidase II [Ectothiorhodospira]MCG5493713.1 signal peptidase II [Ectothiorhodospira variabilis]MCG5505251.1 signal peptidase II [Ectothiorhodospira variabilis]MCG5508388.1 signal peptidase II [Ectothiorhodospira variabilis]MCG5526031.1 signal peptidase II [Ectothiorhodospira haloalkaliphila]
MLKWLWLSFGVIVLDQITKRIAEYQLVQFAPMEILPFLNFALVYNQGAAFSFLSDAGGWQRWFFTALALLVSAIIVWWLYRLKRGETGTAISLALILGGAIGNVIDRILHGHVIDFIDVHYAGYHWPTFNIADSAITIGAVILIATSLMPARPGTQGT